MGSSEADQRYGAATDVKISSRSPSKNTEDTQRPGSARVRNLPPLERVPVSSDTGGTRQISEGKGQKQTNCEWIPWKDRITKTGHRDAVVFVKTFCEQEEDGSVKARRLITAGADGSARVFDLNPSGHQPVVRQRILLELPASATDVSSRRRAFFTTFEMDELTKSANNADEVIVIYGGFHLGQIGAWTITPSGSSLVQTLCGHEKAVQAIRRIRNSPFGGAILTSIIASSSDDGSVRVWNVSERKCLFSLCFGPENPVTDLVPIWPISSAAQAVDPSDEAGASCSLARIAACSWDGVLRILDLDQHSCVGRLQVVQAGGLCAVQAVSASPKAEKARIYVGSDDGSVAVCQCSVEGDVERLRLWNAHNGAITQLLITGAWLVTASEDRTVSLWLLKDFMHVQTFRGHAGAVLTLDVACHDNLVWSGSRDWTIRSWDLQEIELHLWERRRLAEHDQESLLFEQEMRQQAKCAKKSKKKNLNKKSEKKRG